MALSMLFLCYKTHKDLTLKGRCIKISFGKSQSSLKPYFFIGNTALPEPYVFIGMGGVLGMTATCTLPPCMFTCTVRIHTHLGGGASHQFMQDRVCVDRLAQGASAKLQRRGVAPGSWFRRILDPPGREHDPVGNHHLQNLTTS